MTSIDARNDHSHIDPRLPPLSVVTCPDTLLSFDLEDLMNDRMFDSPVFVKNGNSLIQEIACLEDALEFLYEWPKGRRTPIYQTAVRACQQAFQSDYPLSYAKSAFQGFARSAKILEEVEIPQPWMTGPNSGRGGGMVA